MLSIAARRKQTDISFFQQFTIRVFRVGKKQWFLKKTKTTVFYKNQINHGFFGFYWF